MCLRLLRYRKPWWWARETALPVKCLPHKQEALSSSHKRHTTDGRHVLVIPVPAKQAGRPLQLSRQNSDFAASQASTVRPCLQKKKVDSN